MSRKLYVGWRVHFDVNRSLLKGSFYLWRLMSTCPSKQKEKKKKKTNRKLVNPPLEDKTVSLRSIIRIFFFSFIF